MNKQTATSLLIIHHCCTCGTPYGIEETLNKQFHRSGGTFYCPNGHAQVFSTSIEDELKEAKRKLAEEEEDRKWWQGRAEEKAAQLQATSRQLSSTRGQLTKTKNRIAKGICPCCRRQFVNLHKHMENQHPEYAEKESEENQVKNES